MKKSRFSEEKIIAILKELEAGAKATELARKYGVSDVTIYNWKGRYGGMEVSHPGVPRGTPGAFGVYATRRPRDDGPVIAAIEGYVQETPRHGFDRLYPVLRTRGFGKCRLYRVYRALKLNLKRRARDDCLRA